MNKLKKIFIKFENKITFVLTKILSIFPRKKLIYFESFHGKSFNDNPRAIYEEMVQQNIEYQLVWGVKKGYEKIFDLYPDVTYVQRFSWKWFLSISRASIWVINTRTPKHFYKSKQTTYVETWHGTPLKKLGLDIKEIQMPGTTTEKYMANFISESKRWDLLISPNNYSTHIFKHAFGYEGEILETGYPRNDLLVKYGNDFDKINDLKEKIGIPVEKKIVLYAPTWRDDEFYAKGNYKFSLPFSIDGLLKVLDQDTILLTRMHYLVSDRFDFSDYKGSIIDVSNYDEMSHLLLVSDLLITDYSSSFFDYAILKRPFLFFMYDLEKYENNIRGMYLDIEEELPGAIVVTEHEFYNEISKIKENKYTVGQEYITKYDLFSKKFNLQEKGTASKQIIHWLSDKNIF